MRKIIYLLLLFSCSYACAEKSSACELIDDTADMLMQFHQSGLSLDDIEINKEELNPQEVQLLNNLILDAKATPVYKTDLAKLKEIDDFKNKWLELCQVQLNP
ncbi:hypothetical protein [Acinetobacter sp. ANC 3832]|uniref:hypothetical protein n=1 Tax=Acinetobacter sp. ANC 3832 TaxID=1977874 RepID=UPI000A339F3C|nr:hypothetical protein [Acinetobacter sp. ANC 3832]OTG95646.1 hypothetical protein B9T35_03655 [Acinetobacter sp. ANC 3832]